MKTHAMLGIVALVLGQVWCHSALGDEPAFELNIATTSTNQYGSLGFVMGWKFTLTDDICVTRLGIFDDNEPVLPEGGTGDDGLNSSYEIGIYRMSDLTRVAYAVLPSGPPEELAGQGYVFEDHYWYVKLDSPDSPGVWLPCKKSESEYEEYLVAYLTQSTSSDYHVKSTLVSENPCIDVDCLGYYYPADGTYLPQVLDAAENVTSEQYYTPNFLFTLEPPEPPEPTEIDIDIKPGSYPNCINLGSNGVVPVAILSTEDFDATTVYPATVELAGAGVALRGKADKYMAHLEDVNADGLLDLVVQVVTENLDPGMFQDGDAILTAKTCDGQVLEGSDEITIVPPE